MTKRLLATLVGSMLLILCAPHSSFAQASPELKALGEEVKSLREDLRMSEQIRALGKEIEVLQEGQRALQKDLQEIKTLLQARPAAPSPAPAAVPQNVLLSVEGEPFKGEKTAKLTLIEFTDYQ